MFSGKKNIIHVTPGSLKVVHPGTRVPDITKRVWEVAEIHEWRVAHNQTHEQLLSAKNEPLVVGYKFVHPHIA